MLTLRTNGRDITPHKATIFPRLGARTVLTHSHWEYVSLWLRRERKAAALYYWQQAQTFSQAAIGMPTTSAPLLLYYSFMNAVKTLLSARGVAFHEYHGIRGHNMRGPASKIALSNEGVRLLEKGIAPALSSYLEEDETQSTHSLEELLFNLPCIHRTFCLTYKTQRDMFLPLTDCKIVFDPTGGSAYFSAMLSKDFVGEKYIRSLPPTLAADPAILDGRAIRPISIAPVSGQTIKTGVDIASIVHLLKSLRLDINYIAGAETLWYAKAVTRGPARLRRSPLTCTLLAMHRISGNPPCQLGV